MKRSAAIAVAVAALFAATGTHAHAHQRPDLTMTCEPPEPAYMVREAVSDVLGKVESVRVTSRRRYPEQTVTVYQARVRTVRMLNGRPVTARFTHRFSDARSCTGGELILHRGDEAVFFFREGDASPFHVLRPEHYDSSDPSGRYPQDPSSASLPRVN